VREGQGGCKDESKGEGHEGKEDFRRDETECDQTDVWTDVWTECGVKGRVLIQSLSILSSNSPPPLHQSGTSKQSIKRERI
jgi:hypothetical protein